MAGSFYRKPFNKSVNRAGSDRKPVNFANRRAEVGGNDQHPHRESYFFIWRPQIQGKPFPPACHRQRLLPVLLHRQASPPQGRLCQRSFPKKGS